LAVGCVVEDLAKEDADVLDEGSGERSVASK
jgi:hypothetical protein